MQTQPPWSSESNQPAGQVVVGGAQPQILTGQPTNQQIIYVQAPSFKPNPNYRHISYIVLGLGIVFSLLLSFISGTGSEIAYRLGNSMCCGAIGVACILDAMYYNDKTNWQKQTGSDTASSTIGMIADIVFAIACLGMALLFFVM
tara:strand:+ start:72 stop:506 length:435 start_codon:yes stop_codon:yes gene_type:complete